MFHEQLGSWIKSSPPCRSSRHRLSRRRMDGKGRAMNNRISALLLVLFLFLIVACELSSVVPVALPTPDSIASRVAEAKSVAATLTAEVPTAMPTPLPTETSKPRSAQTPMSTLTQVVPTPAFTPTRGVVQSSAQTVTYSGVIVTLDKAILEDSCIHYVPLLHVSSSENCLIVVINASPPVPTIQKPSPTTQSAQKTVTPFLQVFQIEDDYGNRYSPMYAEYRWNANGEWLGHWCYFAVKITATKFFAVVPGNDKVLLRLSEP